MDNRNWKALGRGVLIAIGVWLGLRYLLPVLLPFLLGLALAMLAEPGVRFFEKRLRLPRAAASGLGVGLGLLLMLGLLWIIGAAAYKEMTVLAKGLPGFFETVYGAVTQVRDWAMGLAERAPAGLSGSLTQWVGNLFTDSSALLEKAATGALGMVGNILDGLPGGALTVFTALISSFMISAQLPTIKKRLKAKTRPQWAERGRAMLQQVKTTVKGWFKAQIKLSGVTLLIVAAGYLILRVSHPLLMAAVTAVVDALPVFGTGTVLIPWCLWSLVKGETVRAVGLLALYVIVALTRSALEPKLVGHQLGINPLLTLLALYAGYRLWGVPGMILAPILTVTVKQLLPLANSAPGDYNGEKKEG